MLTSDHTQAAAITITITVASWHGTGGRASGEPYVDLANLCDCGAYSKYGVRPMPLRVADIHPPEQYWVVPMQHLGQ